MFYTFSDILNFTYSKVFSPRLSISTSSSSFQYKRIPTIALYIHDMGVSDGILTQLDVLSTLCLKMQQRIYAGYLVTRPIVIDLIHLCGVTHVCVHHHLCFYSYRATEAAPAASLDIEYSPREKKIGSLPLSTLCSFFIYVYYCHNIDGKHPHDWLFSLLSCTRSHKS